MESLTDKERKEVLVKGLEQVLHDYNTPSVTWEVVERKPLSARLTKTERRKYKAWFGLGGEKTDTTTTIWRATVDLEGSLIIKQQK